MINSKSSIALVSDMASTTASRNQLDEFATIWSRAFIMLSNKSIKTYNASIRSSHLVLHIDFTFVEEPSKNVLNV